MDAAVGQLPDAWSQVRAPLIVPLLRLSVAVCLGMAVLLFLERLYMGVVIVGVKLLRRTPERRYKCDPISEEEDPELGSAAFPSVLVQIPMFNEREVHSTFLRPPIGICRARSSFSSSLGSPLPLGIGSCRASCRGGLMSK
jgi:beta-mannan synthase